jgi:cytochrome b
LHEVRKFAHNAAHALIEPTTMTQPATPTASRTTRVWDLPTRLFHWSLVASFIGLVITGNLGGNWMVWHFRLGYAVFTLLLFRTIWGFIGGRWSRFASFIYAPASVWAYLQGRSKPEHSVGHSPLAAGSVFALLGFLALQVASGLVSDDEIANQGPLNKFVSNARASLATWYHKEVGNKILVALVVLHLVAILFYLYKKKTNLILPMLQGDKQLTHTVLPSRDDAASRAVAALVLALCAGAVWWVVKLGG